MNHSAHIASLARKALLLACMFVCALALGACTLQEANRTADEHAAENRQYMAQLNQKTRALDEVLEQFRAAVSASDTVGMKAAADDAVKIVDQIKSSKPTEALAEVKDSYVEGLEGMQEAMNDYVELYMEMSGGGLSKSAYDSKLKAVQSAYDEAVEKISATDEELTKLANE